MPTLRYLISNAGLACLVYYSHFKNHDGAMNILTFYLWFMFVVSLLGIHKDVIKELSRTYKKTIIPKVIDATYDVVIISTFACFGSFVFAVIYLIHAVLTNHIINEALKIQNERENTTSDNA